MTTNRNHWKVKKSKRLANPPVGASPTYTGSWHVESNDGEYATFTTHAEALTYADRMARTVENALPRVTSACDPIPNSPKPPEHSIWYGSRRDSAYWLHVPHGMSTPLIVAQEELAPLALTLLALHHTNHQQPRKNTTR